MSGFIIISYYQLTGRLRGRELQNLNEPIAKASNHHLEQGCR